ncbi:MAG: hypothetical protein KDK89_23440, partial [Alphaproteobacteria bacterium]|nr:hypothetical protein [Alphaproteobacteria bacterium]
MSLYRQTRPHARNSCPIPSKPVNSQRSPIPGENAYPGKVNQATQTLNVSGKSALGLGNGQKFADAAGAWARFGHAA